MAWEQKLRLPEENSALPGRAAEMAVPEHHFVLGNSLQPPFPQGMATTIFAMGCFWGAERKFWEMPGVFSSAAGYAGGTTPNPTYEEVCSGGTGHTEVVLVVYDPQLLEYKQLLKTFWESHDPTQGMRQGNDVGTQYRSAIYTQDAGQLAIARQSLETYQHALSGTGYGEVTTEIRPLENFYYAEHVHQQYLAKVPNGYCGLGGTGVGCDIAPLVTID